jgi:transcriptional regulator with XRE-family HTH domain
MLFEMKTPAQLIQEGRTKLGLSQRELARRVGCSPASIALIEKSYSYPSYARCVALGGALSIQPDDLWRAVNLARERSGSQKFHDAQMVVASIHAPSVDHGAVTEGRVPPSDPELQRAIEQVRAAFGDPDVRPALLAMLDSLARLAKSNRPRSNPS